MASGTSSSSSDEFENDSNSDTFSCNEGSGFYWHKPVATGINHLKLPEDLCNEYDNNGNILNSHVEKILNLKIDKKKYIDEVFAKYDDQYAKLVPKTPMTPAMTLFPDSSIHPTTSLSKPWKYVTLEKREARRRAAIEGQKNVFNALRKKGIQPEEYFSSVFSITPKTDMFSATLSAPDFSSNLNTPIGGVKTLPNFSDEITVTAAPQCYDISLTENLPPDVKSTLLSGIVCHVDVRSDKRDVSKSIEKQVQTLGARIEKNFTKKVTHVIFKEGKNSTYLKAKQREIPLVSVMWIEACIKCCGIADPAQYPPIKMENYERLPLHSKIPKRRMKFYNPNSKIRKYILEHFYEPNFVPTLNGRKLESKKSETALKEKSEVIGSKSTTKKFKNQRDTKEQQGKVKTSNLRTKNKRNRFDPDLKVVTSPTTQESTAATQEPVKRPRTRATTRRQLVKEGVACKPGSNNEIINLE